MRFQLRFLVFIVVLSVISSCSWFKKSSPPKKTETPIQKVEATPDEGAKLFYQFKKSPNKWFAKMQDFEIKKSDIVKSSKYKAMKMQTGEYWVALLILDKIVGVENLPDKVIFYNQKLLRPVDSILTQFGVTRDLSTIQWEASSSKDKKLLAMIGSKKVFYEDLNKEHYLYGLIKTKEYLLYLSEIDRRMKNLVIKRESANLELTVQEYRKKYIYDHVTKGINFTSEEEKAELKKKGFDFFVEKYLMELPIQINWQPFDYRPNFPTEHVAYIGPEKSEVTLSIFSDQTNPNSRTILKNFLELQKKYSGIRLEYRPILAENNEFQMLREKLYSCIWRLFPEQYWEFLTKTQEKYGVKLQESFEKKMDEQGIDTKKVLKCSINAYTKEIVNYQKQYSDYIGIKGGPVVIVSGKVLIPPISIKQVKQVINRQLSVPDAGVW